MAVIPKKFYVTRVYRSAEEMLGWMVVADNEETKKFKQSKEKADRWATPYHNSGQQAMEPIYVDNEPRTGFRMVTNVSRYSTSNVVWRIMHPEGFEFEITSDNLCDLLETNTIVEGEFQDELFFTHNKKLVNEKTKLFSDMIEKEEKKKEQKKNAQEIEVGDVISLKIQESYSGYKERDFLYCGRYHSISPNKNDIYRHKAISTISTKKSTLRFVIKDLIDNKYYAVTQLVDFTIKNNYPVEREVVISEMNEQLKNNHSYIGTEYYYENYIPYNVQALYINDKPYKFEDLKIEFITKRLDEIESLSHNRIYRVGNQLISSYRFEHINSNPWYGTSTSYNSSLKLDGNEYFDQRYAGQNGVLHSLNSYTISGYEENGIPTISPTSDLNIINISQTIEVGYYTL